MKTIIIAAWFLVVSVSSGSVSNKYEIGISSGYGGAYGYAPKPIIINLDRELSSNGAISSGYYEDYMLRSGIIDENKKEQSKVIVSSSDYGTYNFASTLKHYYGTYDFAPTPKNNANRNLMSDIAVSSGYGGAYGYFPTSSFSVNNVIKAQNMMEMSLVMNMRKMESKLQKALNFSPGYSGYGNGDSSYSGYSRYPNYTGYGFAYASNWLGTI